MLLTLLQNTGSVCEHFFHLLDFLHNTPNASGLTNECDVTVILRCFASCCHILKYLILLFPIVYADCQTTRNAAVVIGDAVGFYFFFFTSETSVFGSNIYRMSWLLICMVFSKIRFFFNDFVCQKSSLRSWNNRDTDNWISCETLCNANIMKTQMRLNFK